MSSAATNTTDDVSSKVSLFGAIVFAVANATTVLTDLVFIVTKSTIQGSKLTKLIPLVIVLTFGR
jgi:hypothetical protein